MEIFAFGKILKKLINSIRVANWSPINKYINYQTLRGLILNNNFNYNLCKMLLIKIKNLNLIYYSFIH